MTLFECVSIFTPPVSNRNPMLVVNSVPAWDSLLRYIESNNLDNKTNS